MADAIDPGSRGADSFRLADVARSEFEVIFERSQPPPGPSGIIIEDANGVPCLEQACAECAADKTCSTRDQNFQWTFCFTPDEVRKVPKAF